VRVSGKTALGCLSAAPFRLVRIERPGSGKVIGLLRGGPTNAVLPARHGAEHPVTPYRIFLGNGATRQTKPHFAAGKAGSKK
jgi:hypothetical protein